MTSNKNRGEQLQRGKRTGKHEKVDEVQEMKLDLTDVDSVLAQYGPEEKLDNSSVVKAKARKAEKRVHLDEKVGDGDLPLLKTREGFTWAVNPFSMHFAYNKRFYKGVEGSKVHLDLIYTIGGKKSFFSGSLPIWNRQGDVYATSDDLVLVKVRVNNLAQDLDSYFIMIDEQFGNSVTCLQNSFKACVIHYKGGMSNNRLAKFFNAVSAHYRRNYHRYATLEHDIRTLYYSWFVDYVRQDMLDRNAHLDEELEASVVYALVSHGYNNEEITSMLSFSVWTKLRSYAYIVLHFLMRFIFIHGLLHLIFDGIYSYYIAHTMGAIAESYLLLQQCNEVITTRSSHLRRLYRDYTTTDPRVSLLKCSTLEIEKSLADISQIDIPLLPGAQVDASYDPVDHELTVDSPVTIYGSTVHDVPIVYPSSHVQNLHVGVVKRMAYDRPFDPVSVANFKSFAMKRLKEMDDVILPLDIDIEEFLVRQYGPKRAQSLIPLIDSELTQHDTYSSLFVKPECYPKEVENFKPRMIFSRSDAIVAKFGAYFYKIGQELGTRFSKDASIFYTSKSRPDDLGYFAERMDDFSNVILESDVSGWDGSLLEHFLELELWFLKNKVKGMPEEVQFLYNNWYNVRGKADGLDVHLSYGRRSGDLWTSAFNSLLNILVTMWVYDMEWDSFMMMVLGDDNVVALEIEPDIDDCVQRYESIGMNCTIVRRESMALTTFCSGMFWKVNGLYRWGNLPFRILFKFGFNHNNHPPKLHKRLLLGIAKGMLPTAGHIPLVGSILRAIADSGEEDGLKAYYDNRTRNPYRPQGGVPLYPAADTYVQFCERYGIPMQIVMKMEEWIECNLTIDDFPLIWDDEVFVEGALTDLGLERRKGKNPIAAKFMSIERQEEASKLDGVMNLGSALSNAWAFGSYEDKLCEPLLGRTKIHAVLHTIFTFVSYFDFEKGVSMHEYYNSFVSEPFTCRKTTKKKKPRRKKPPQRKFDKREKNQLRSIIGQLIKHGSTAAGGYFGGPAGAALGSSAADVFNNITGFGDYEVKENSIVTDNAPVTMHYDNGSVRVRHTEYIGTVQSATSFTSTEYPINPGMSETFPWLANMAQSFQTYRIRGMVVMYKPLSAMAVGSTNTAMGVVVIATQYDSSAPSFLNRREMEAYMFSTSSVPFEHQVHPVECALGYNVLEQQYLRYGAVTEDLRWSDHGQFTVAVDGCQAGGNDIGELWVAYDVEFQKPRITSSGYATARYDHLPGGLYDNTNPFSLVVPTLEGNLGGSIANTSGGWDTYVFPPLLDVGYYYIMIGWKGSSTAGLGATFTTTNCTLQTFFRGDASNNLNNAGTTSTVFLLNYVVKIDAPGAKIDLSSVTAPTSGLTVDLWVMQIGPEKAQNLAKSPFFEEEKTTEDDEYIYQYLQSLPNDELRRLVASNSTL